MRILNHFVTPFIYIPESEINDVVIFFFLISETMTQYLKSSLCYQNNLSSYQGITNDAHNWNICAMCALSPLMPPALEAKKSSVTGVLHKLCIKCHTENIPIILIALESWFIFLKEPQNGSFSLYGHIIQTASSFMFSTDS